MHFTENLQPSTRPPPVRAHVGQSWGQYVIVRWLSRRGKGKSAHPGREVAWAYSVRLIAIFRTHSTIPWHTNIPFCVLARGCVFIITRFGGWEVADLPRWLLSVFQFAYSISEKELIFALWTSTLTPWFHFTTVWIVSKVFGSCNFKGYNEYSIKILPSRVNFLWAIFVKHTILSPWNCVAQMSLSQEKNFDNPESNSWSNPTKIRTNNLDWAVTCLFEVRTFIIGAAREAFKKLLHYTQGGQIPRFKNDFQ